MKKLFGILVLVMFLVSATGMAPDRDDNKQALVGTWELVSFYMYDGTDVIDTVPTTEGYRQIKMYNEKGNIMWTRYVPKDSVEWFGYGTYSATENTLTEKLEYGSASMMKIIDTLRVFQFELQVQENAFSQITLDEEGNRISSENYKRLN
ncbi:MAG: hypothetical protein V7724_14375 [Sediminicola sp.]|tara:strand:- start:33515 stop:33964 length:450 start_codon:yes stop_codon:yes gene_type:complete